MVSTPYRRIVTAAISGLLLASGLLAAQGNSQGKSNPKDGEAFKLSVKTNLVLVPVIVTDKHGNHVQGLKAEDFEIKENGSAQKIVRFEELSSDTSKVERPVVAANGFSNELTADHPKKLEIIALDHVNTPFASGADANRGIVDFLAKGTDSNTLLALVSIERNGVHIIHNFTSDPSVLSAAVRKVQLSLTSRDTRTQNIPGDTLEADAEAAQLLAFFADTSIGGGSANELAAAARAANAQARARVDASRQSQDALITLECLQQLAQYFSGVPGRKSLVWASTAFPFSLGSSPGEASRGTTNEDWQRTFRMLQDANVAVYPVDVGGLVQGGPSNIIQTLNSGAIRAQGGDGGVGLRGAGLESVSNGSLVDPTEGRHQTMRTVADMTGGQPFYNSNDAADLFRRAGDDCAQYYEIAYYTSSSGKAGWRKLTVKVRHPDVKVRSRSGFYYSSPEANPELTQRADELMALSSDLSFSSLPIRGQWRQVVPAGDKRKEQFVLSIPAGVPMVDSEHDRHISMDFRIIATNSAGETIGNIGQRLEANLPPDDAKTIQTKGLDYANELTLPPGQYKVHFVVRDNLRGTFGSVVVPLKVE